MKSFARKKPPSRTRIALQCLAVCLVLLMWNVYRSIPTPAVVSHIPIVILKLPRSGSSWLTSELNAFSDVFISKEIVQSGDLEKFPTWDIEDHLIRALRAPVGKLSNRGRWWNPLPDARYIEDYLAPTHMWSWKPLHRLRLVGFTVNPEHVSDVDWAHIASQVPGMRVVALVRANLVKTAISDYTGRVSKKLCGSANTRGGSSEDEDGCGGRESVQSVPWDISQFLGEVRRWRRRTVGFTKAVQEVQQAVETGDPRGKKGVVTVMYERMQMDKQAALTALFQSVGMGMDDDGGAAGAAGGAAGGGASSFLPPEGEVWRKRGRDDLRTVLSSYRNIEAALVDTGPHACPCLLQQLRAQAPTRGVQESYDAAVCEPGECPCMQ